MRKSIVGTTILTYLIMKSCNGKTLTEGLSDLMSHAMQVLGKEDTFRMTRGGSAENRVAQLKKAGLLIEEGNVLWLTSEGLEMVEKIDKLIDLVRQSRVEDRVKSAEQVANLLAKGDQK